MEKRNPNTYCSICQNPIYKRPNEIAKSKSGLFCGKACYGISQAKPKPCVVCGKSVLASKNKKTCSAECSNVNRVSRNKARTGIKFNGATPRNNTEQRLRILYQAFQFKHCMVQDCEYNKTYDVHRLIPGKDGGKYEIGNMFAICPMHHAEVTRNLIVLTKIKDDVLVIS